MAKNTNIISLAKQKKEQQEQEKAFEELKSQMLYFISASSNIMNILEEHGKSIAYLLSKDEAWMKANEEVLKEYSMACNQEATDDEQTAK